MCDLPWKPLLKSLLRKLLSQHSLQPDSSVSSVGYVAHHVYENLAFQLEDRLVLKLDGVAISRSANSSLLEWVPEILTAEETTIG
jgi:hypothetical protein